MNKLVTFASALALTSLLGACASSGGQTAQATTSEAGGSTGDQVAATESRLDPNAVRCKTQIKTGTRISNKICKTNAQWEQEAIDSRTTAEQIQRGALNQGHTEGAGGG